MYTLPDAPDEAFQGEDVLCLDHAIFTVPPGSTLDEQDWIWCKHDCGRCYACEASGHRQEAGVRVTLAGDGR
jgi:hypothetical protein